MQDPKAEARGLNDRGGLRGAPCPTSWGAGVGLRSAAVYDAAQGDTRFWATVYKTVRPVLSDRCLSCLSVCL